MFFVGIGGKTLKSGKGAKIVEVEEIDSESGRGLARGEESGDEEIASVSCQRSCSRRDVSNVSGLRRAQCNLGLKCEYL